MKRTLTVLLLSLFTARSALADDPPAVTLIPDVAEHARKDVTKVMPDRSLPASKEFTVQYRLQQGTTVAAGVLWVWPAAEHPCDKPQPPDNSSIKQFYKLGMSISKVGDDVFLAAKVPALQVDQRFCFRVQAKSSLPADAAQAVESEIARALIEQMDAPNPNCDHILGWRALADATQHAFDVRGQFADVDDAAQAVLDHLLANGARQQCGALAAANAVASGSQGIFAAQDAVTRAFQVLQALPHNQLPAPKEPLLFINGSLRSASQLLNESESTSWAAAANQLAARALATPKSAPSFDAWVAIFQTLAAASDKAKGVDAAKKASSKAKPPAELELWDGTRWVGPDDFVRKHSRESQAISRQILAQVAQTNDVKRFEESLDGLIAAEGNRDEAEKSFNEAKTKKVTEREKMRTLLRDSFATPGVQRLLQVLERPTETRGLSGAGQTPAKANYASPDLGAFFAFAGSETWFLPYLGLNVYLVPVDRTIKPSQLTGSRFEQVGQRLSLTLGATLASPTTSKTIEAPFLSKFPIVAIGCRVGSYSRIVAGTVFYTLHHPNPASSSKFLRASVFVGASLDIDIVHLLTQASP